jgi:hypothetical protein
MKSLDRSDCIVLVLDEEYFLPNFQAGVSLKVYPQRHYFAEGGLFHSW